MIRDIEIAWASGIIEGEGCFGLYKHTKNSYKASVQVKMCDKDVIDKLYNVFKVGTIISGLPKNPKHKRYYTWRVRKKKDVATILNLILPHLCNRRTSKAHVILDYLAGK